MARPGQILRDSFRTGSWLTAERARGYSLILLAFYAFAIVAWIALADGLVDRNGKPIGTDFSNVYAAGQLTREGRAADAYDPALQHAAEKRVFGPATPFFGWHYPPFFLMAAAALAALPYAWALLAWMVLTLPAYLAAMRAICPRAGDAAGRCGVSGRVRQHRPWTERVSHRGAARRCAALARSQARARRHAVGTAGLQAAVRHPHSARAAGDRPLDGDRRCLRDHRRALRRHLARARRRRVERVRRLRRVQPRRSCSKPAPPAGRRSSRSSRPFAISAARRDRLRRAGGAAARACALARLALAQAARPTNSRPRRWRSPACWRRPTCSTTT